MIKLDKGCVGLPNGRIGELTGGYLVQGSIIYKIFPLTIDISTAVVTLGAALTYNGSQQTKQIQSVVVDGVTLTNGVDYIVSGNTATTVGTYTMTITGIGDYEGTVTAEYSIAKLSLTKPTVSGSYTYNGSTRSATISNYNSTYMTRSGTASTATAGSYTLTFSLKDKNNTQWSDGTTGNVTGTWAIAKLSLTKPTISGSFTYDGNSKSCTVSNMNSTYITQSGTTSATDAGTYTVKFTLKSTSNTQWSDGTTTAVSRTWSIAVLKLTKPTVSGSFTYDGNGKSCTITGFNSTYMEQSGTTSSTDAGSFIIAFSLKSTKNTQWADGTTANVTGSWTIAKATGSISVSPTSLSIVGAAGTTKTATITYTGDGSISVASSATGVATVSRSGTTVTVTSVAAGSATITITLAAGTNYTGASCTIKVTVQTAVVFGVMWDYANSSTALTRLSASNDPNGYANTTVSTEPTAAIGTDGGNSPFDSYMPWKGMIKYNASAAGAVSTWTSNSNDTVVYIPEFYCKIIDDTTNSKLYIYISSASISDFIKHPGSGRYVGRYHTGSGYVTKTGLAPLININRVTARTNSSAKGSKWYQYDFATYSAICLLYIVEWADWNSQIKIGRGHVDYGSNQRANSGGTDSLTYHTGRASGTDGKTAVQYRWIENLWGNVDQWVDGINSNDRVVYVCTNPANFADDTSANYTAAGVTLPTSDGYIKGMSPGSLGWCLIPDASGGSSSTYVSDNIHSSAWQDAFAAGGYFYSKLEAGLFKLYSYNKGEVFTNLGARLMIVP